MTTLATTPYILRPATEEDQPFLRTLNEMCYHEVVTRQFGYWDAEIQAHYWNRKWESSEFQVIVVDGKDVGALAVEENAEHVFISEILIAPEHQGRGLGTTLLLSWLTHARALGVPLRLQVLRENRAIGLYERLGFRRSGQTGTHLLMEAR